MDLKKFRSSIDQKHNCLVDENYSEIKPIELAIGRRLIKRKYTLKTQHTEVEIPSNLQTSSDNNNNNNTNEKMLTQYEN